MKVGLACSRWLGLRCLEQIVLRRSETTLVGAYFEEKAKPYPGDSTQEEARARAEFLDVPVLPLAELVDGSDLLLTMLVSHIYTREEIQSATIINLHPAPLPWYRGCNSYSWAIANGDPYYAVTLHLVEAGIDTGPVIAQKWLPILADDTAWTLYQRSQCVALELFTEKLPDLIQGFWYDRLLQDERLARYYRRDQLPGSPCRASAF